MSSLRTSFTYLRAGGHDDRPAAEHRRRHAGAAAVGVGPLFASGARRWWVEPYAALRLEADASVVARSRRSPHRRGPQPRRRSRRSSATARGRADGSTPGADGITNNADDILIATGETLLQVQDRVLGVGVNSSSLFPELPGYGVVGVRGGVRFGPQRAADRFGEPDRRELPRHQLGRGRTGARRVGQVHHAILVNRDR